MAGRALSRLLAPTTATRTARPPLSLPFDLAEASPTPSRYDVLFQDALTLAPVASVSRGVQLDEVINDSLDHVVLLCPRSGSRGHLFGSWTLPAATSPRAAVARLRASAIATIGYDPIVSFFGLPRARYRSAHDFRAGRLNDQIEARYLPVGDFTARVGRSQRPNPRFPKHGRYPERSGVSPLHRLAPLPGVLDNASQERKAAISG